MEKLDLALAELASDFAARIAKVKEYAKQVKEVEEMTGLTLIRSYGSLKNSYDRIEIKREDLPKIRKAVGRLEMDGKYLPWNFESTKEICVEMNPKAEKFNRLRFMYRAKYRPGGKCEIVEQVSKSKALVCKV
jgi:hypothetical protein